MFSTSGKIVSQISLNNIDTNLLESYYEIICNVDVAKIDLNVMNGICVTKSKPLFI